MKKIYFGIIFAGIVFMGLLIDFFVISGFYENVSKIDANTESATNVYLNSSFLNPDIKIINEIKPTKKLEFKVGDEIRYKEESISVPAIQEGRKYEIKDYVEETIAKMINGFGGYQRSIRDIVFRVDEIYLSEGVKIYKVNVFYKDAYSSWRDTETYLIDENGNIISCNVTYTEGRQRPYTDNLLNMTMERYNIESNFLGRSSFGPYSNYMSKLNESFSWTQTVRREMRLNMNVSEDLFNIENKNTGKNITLKHCSDDEITTKYEVVGIENINGKKCFKVNCIETVKNFGCENISTSLSWNTVVLETGRMLKHFQKNEKMVATLWIDYEKRILVKAEEVNDGGRYELRLIG